MKSNKGTYRPLLRHGNFMKLLIGYNISRFGDSIDSIVFSWIMYEVTGSASMLALIFAVNYLPTILLQPFAAVWSSRLPKVPTIAVCNTVRFLGVAATALLYTFDALNVAMLFAFVLLNSTVEAFESPASSALSPMILPPELYTVGSSFRSAVGRIVELIGLACAGGIIGLFGSTTALLIDAATFLICAATVATIRVKEKKPEKTEAKPSYFTELKGGIAYTVKSPVVRMLLMLGAFLNFSAVPINNFQTAYIADTMQMGPEALSVGGIIMTATMGLGAFVVPHLLKKLARKRLLLISAVGENLSYFCFAAAAIPTEPILRMLLLLMGVVLMGFFCGIINVLFSALFMEQVRSEYMARVSGITNAVLTSMMPVGSLICAAAALYLPLEALFWISGAVMILIFLPITRMKGYKTI